MDVQVEGSGNRTAGGNYTEDNSVHVRLEVGAIGADRDRLRGASAEECGRIHRQLVAVRAQLWRMFIRHPTAVPYLMAWLGFGLLIAAFWGDVKPYPHGAILLAWGFLVIGPTALLMARAREAMYQELLEVRRQLIQAERRLVRMEAERRVTANDPSAFASSGEERDGTEVPELRRYVEEGAAAQDEVPALWGTHLHPRDAERPDTAPGERSRC